MHSLDNQLASRILTDYHVEGWIYPAPLADQLDLSLPQIYHILTDLEKQDKIVAVYELRCSNCLTLYDRVEVFNQIPKQFSCKHCGEVSQGMASATLVFHIKQ